MSANVTTLIDLLRHGEPVGGQKYRGQTDDPLSDKGWAQMRTAVGDHCPWDVIVCSPLLRCQAFAQELSVRHGVPLEVDPRWQELGFGEWEGRTAAELMANDPQRLKCFWNDPVANTPPGGEALTAFHARIQAAWSDLLAHHAGRHALVVAHAGTIRMIVRLVLDMPLDRLFRIHVPNAGLTRVRVDASDREVLPMLVFHGGQL